MALDHVLSELDPRSYLDAGWSWRTRLGVALLSAGICAGSGAVATHSDLESSLWCGALGLLFGGAIGIVSGPGKVQLVGPISLHTCGQVQERPAPIHCLVCGARHVEAWVCLVRQQLRLGLVLPLWWRRHLILTCSACRAEHVAAVRPELLASYSADALVPHLTRSPHVF